MRTPLGSDPAGTFSRRSANATPSPRAPNTTGSAFSARSTASRNSSSRWARRCCAVSRTLRRRSSSESADAAVASALGGRILRTVVGAVVALAGATGSGKSSLFNALVGEEVAQAGTRRPTTSTP